MSGYPNNHFPPGRYTDHFIDPDYIARESDDQLPTVSTIGRGPIGEGVSIEVTQNEPGVFTFRLFSDKTGETVMQSPNLSAGVVYARQFDEGHVEITIERDGTTRSYLIALPQGDAGSRIFTIVDMLNRSTNMNDTYRVARTNLMWDGVLGTRTASPQPRDLDTVMFMCQDASGIYLAVGHIVHQNVTEVFILCRTYIPIPIPYVNEDGGNWFVNGHDTGVPSVVQQLPPITTPVDNDVLPSVSDDNPDVYKSQLHFKLPRSVAFTEPTTVVVDNDVAPSVLDISPSVNESSLQFRIPQAVQMLAPTAEQIPPGSLPTVIDRDPSSNFAQFHFSIPKGDKGDKGDNGRDSLPLNIANGLFRAPGSTKPLPDLPDFLTTNAGDAFIVSSDDVNTAYDLYIHLTDATDWFIVDNWGGVPGPEGEPGMDGLAMRLMQTTWTQEDYPNIDQDSFHPSTVDALVGDMVYSPSTGFIYQVSAWTVTSPTEASGTVTPIGSITGIPGKNGLDSIMVKNVIGISAVPTVGMIETFNKDIFLTREPKVGDYFNIVFKSYSLPTRSWIVVAKVTNLTPDPARPFVIETEYVGVVETTGEKGDKGDKGDTSPVVQVTGQSTTDVMSQKATTDQLALMVRKDAAAINSVYANVGGVTTSIPVDTTGYVAGTIPKRNAAPAAGTISSPAPVNDDNLTTKKFVVDLHNSHITEVTNPHGAGLNQTQLTYNRILGNTTTLTGTSLNLNYANQPHYSINAPTGNMTINVNGAGVFSAGKTARLAFSVIMGATLRTAIFTGQTVRWLNGLPVFAANKVTSITFFWNGVVLEGMWTTEA